MPVKKSQKIWKEWSWILVLLLVLATGWALDNPWVQDIWSGWGYVAEGATLEVREALRLTPEGERIFKATRPSVDSDVEVFNAACPNFERGDQHIVLGCYADNQIYVFEITHEQLVDGNKVTMAHELLHAAWSRLSEKEKLQVESWLDEVYEDNKDWFEAQLDSYDDEARLEEIYTRAGTTLENLPDELEKHYAKYFQDRKQIVMYYQNYRAPFELLVQEMEELNEKIQTVRTETEKERENYRSGVAALNEKISQFNKCADTAGCFANEAQFAARRAALSREKEDLEVMRVNLNTKIDENNERIRKYRELKASLGELNQAVDSRLEETQVKE